MALSPDYPAGGGDGGASRGKTILVVEDDANTRRVLVLLLEIQGYEVLQTADGESGLDLARSVGPDLVVSDLQLPGISGIEMADSIHRSTSSMPVIAITSGPETLIDRAERSRHFIDLLRKPIDVDHFLEVVDAVIAPDGG